MGWNKLMSKMTAQIEEENLPDMQKQDEFLEKLAGMTAFTPDAGALERRMRWYLFVPDEMMSHHYDHARLGANAIKVALAITEDTFTLWKKREENKAIAVPLRIQQGSVPTWKKPEECHAIRAPVRGELFMVNAQTLIKLDTHRENGVRFKRERVKVVRPYTKIQLKKVPLVIEGQDPVDTWVRDEETGLLSEPLNVWMYVGIKEYWEPRMDNGFEFTTVRRFRPNNPKLDLYYYFTPEEYD